MARVTKDPDERREELMDNAESLFYHKGFEKTSVSEIVKKTQVAQGTFYYYFKTKEDILTAVVARMVGRMVGGVLAEFEKTPLNAIQKLKVVIQTMLTYDQQETLFVNELYRMKYWSLLDAMWREYKAEFTPLLLKVCQQGVQEGTMHMAYPEQTAALMILNLDFLQEAVFLREDEEQIRNKALLVQQVIVQLLQIKEEDIVFDIK